VVGTFLEIGQAAAAFTVAETDAVVVDVDADLVDRGRDLDLDPGRARMPCGVGQRFAYDGHQILDDRLGDDGVDGTGEDEPRSDIEQGRDLVDDPDQP
jgi:hypothetical protein